MTTAQRHATLLIIAVLLLMLVATYSNWGPSEGQRQEQANTVPPKVPVSLKDHAPMRVKPGVVERVVPRKGPPTETDNTGRERAALPAAPQVNHVLARARRYLATGTKEARQAALQQLRGASEPVLQELLARSNGMLNMPLERELGITLLELLAEITHPFVGAFFRATFTPDIPDSLVVLYAVALARNPSPEIYLDVQTVYLARFRHDAYVGGQLLSALAATRRPEVWAFLQSEFTANPINAYAALAAIADYGPEENRPALELLARKGRPGEMLSTAYQSLAIKAVAAFGDSRAVGLLEETLLDTPTEAIRRECASALASLRK